MAQIDFYTFSKSKNVAKIGVPCARGWVPPAHLLILTIFKSEKSCLYYVQGGRVDLLIRDGGSTALHTVYTIYTVFTVYAVQTA